MQNPIDQGETFIQMETVIDSNGPRPKRTFTVRRKATKRSERCYQNTAAPLSSSPQAEETPARKKQRLEGPAQATTDEAAKKTASSTAPPTVHLKVR
jgi:hypothetical protein